MKNTFDNHVGASFAIILVCIIGGLAPIGAKYALRELGPFTILFIRTLIMLGVLLPIVRRSLHHYWNHKKRLLLLRTFWTGNVMMFMIGIKYTTAVASQIVYMGVPIFVIIENFILGNERIQPVQFFGILIGFLGAVCMIIRPTDSSGFGSAFGNALIALGSVFWSLYLVYSKRIGVHVTPVGLTFSGALVGSVISGVCAAVFEHPSITSVLTLLPLTVLSLLFLGLITGVGMIFLYQWGIKYGSALIASSTAYLGTVVAGVTGYFLLGEKITVQFVFGAILILIGAVSVGTLPILHHETRRA